jgi:NarL family two-component system response regulator LiaR
LQRLISEQVTVVLVEDHVLTRTGLRSALAANGMLVLGEAEDGIAAEDLIVRTEPAVALIDIGLPLRDGLALTRALKQSAPLTRALILTMHELDSEVLDAVAAGACGYCMKSSDVATVIDAVRIVAHGGSYFDARSAGVVLRRLARTPAISAEGGLSQREQDVLRLMVDGYGNLEIAEDLMMSLGAVKGHIRDILRKLSASNRTQAAVNATRKGYI